MTAAALRRRRGALLPRGLAIAWLSCAMASAQAPDETLWGEIEALRLPPASMPAVERFRAAALRLESLAQKARQYASLFPGGAHRREAVAAELSALFDLGCLSEGDFTSLRQAALGHSVNPLDAEIRAEGAYWLILSQHIEASAPPTSAPVFDQPSPLIEAYRSYVSEFPGSRHAPLLAAAVVDAALARGALDAARETLAALKRGHPAHQITERLAGAIRAAEAIGKPFQATFRLTNGETVSTEAFHGRPLLILLWTPDEAQGVAMVEQIKRVTRERPELRVIGIPLGRPEAGAYAEAWQIVEEPLGLGSEFARSWGVARSPTVFAVSARGLLLGVFNDDRWQAAAE